MTFDEAIGELQRAHPGDAVDRAMREVTDLREVNANALSRVRDVAALLDRLGADVGRVFAGERWPMPDSRALMAARLQGETEERDRIAHYILRKAGEMVGTGAPQPADALHLIADGIGRLQHHRDPLEGT